MSGLAEKDASLLLDMLLAARDARAFVADLGTGIPLTAILTKRSRPLARPRVVPPWAG